MLETFDKSKYRQRNIAVIFLKTTFKHTTQNIKFLARMASTENVQNVAYLTRREIFSACHRLHSNHLSDSENRNIYGKCNSKNGHGHNYIVEVTLKGRIDPQTGMVINISDLKEIMNEAIMVPLDHKNIDLDVPYFSGLPGKEKERTMHRNGIEHENKVSKLQHNQMEHANNIGRVSTVENIAVYVWTNIAGILLTNSKYTATLDNVKIWETEKNIVTYRGENVV